ncbi:Hypothetical predicted protein [Paramuricea clavata]|uniref:Uncharacterized protein n=1 Tax=Paramuricea clavata TaxID=317549 RepID=A0A6S7FEW2_PARCT|nr:Hypothetical predicted protein [Paramuricea clavata]
MSEVLEEYKRKLDWKLKLSSEAPLTYVRRQVDLANEILFWERHQYKSEVDKSNKELEKYKKKCSDLEQERDNLLEQMMNEKDKMEQEISDLTLVNKELAEYVETLEKRDFLNCQGRKMHEVGSKQKGRKLRVLKNKAQCALWFMKSFGLEMSQIKLKDEDGSNYSFDYAADHDASSNLCQNDIKERVEQILFLLDKFCVGDAVYHEFTSLSDDLPKSYLVKQMKGNMNKTYLPY